MLYKIATFALIFVTAVMSSSSRCLAVMRGTFVHRLIGRFRSKGDDIQT
jgi:hypothetical protein